jgi:hypothetical protein
MLFVAKPQLSAWQKWTNSCSMPDEQEQIRLQIKMKNEAAN